MKQAVVTYIFGKNKEILREPLVITPDTEYICVTDNDLLRSRNWHIVYNEHLSSLCSRDKMANVKYNPFMYTDAALICVIDGSLQITHDLSSFFNILSCADLMLKVHPYRPRLDDELNKWSRTRRTFTTNIKSL